MKLAYSLIIPVFNQLHYTKACLDSLLHDSERPHYEIIIIDNGSSDGTREYLEEMSRKLDRSPDNLIPIFNEKNRGVAPAWNQGLKTCTGQYIGILNNDILVSRGWFKSLLWAMEHHKLALASPFAAVGPLNYDLEARARAFTKKNIGKIWVDYDFCAFVLSRKTFEKVGLFDENFLVGGFEDTDYCYRLKSAGLRYGVSGASFIHHFGSQTLGEFKKRGDKHEGPNREYFIKKWGVDPSVSDCSLRAKLRRSWRKIKLHWDLM